MLSHANASMRSIVVRVRLVLRCLAILTGALGLSGVGIAKETALQPAEPGQARAIRLAISKGRDLATASQVSSCSEFVAALPTDFRSGTIVVPEDWNKPQGRKIHVFFYGQLDSGKTPVMFFNGGPGGDSHESFSLFVNEPLARDFSFIFMDQRGTGCSTPYPSEPTSETVQRLSHYGSTEIVKDAEAIRRKLLGQSGKWKIFGQSYGGLIVHRYITSKSASRNVISAHAHGASIMRDFSAFLAHRLLSLKSVSEDYFLVYPDDRSRVAKIRALIPDDQCFTDGATKVCGSGVADSLSLFLGFPDSWPTLHSIVGKLLRDPHSIDEEYFANLVKNLVFGAYAGSGLAGNIISKLDISDGMSDKEACHASIKVLLSWGEFPQNWLFNECRLLIAVENEASDALIGQFKKSQQIRISDVKESLKRQSKLRFYLYSGGKDVFVPPATFTEEVKALGGFVRYRNFENSGHDGFIKEQQIWRELR